MTTAKLLSVGALVWDTIFVVLQLPSGGGKYLPLSVQQLASGMATSAACAARRQGADVSLWASVGDDLTGERLLHDIAAEGVDCSLVRRIPQTPSAISSIVMDENGERIIVPFYHPQLLSEPKEVPSGFDAVLVDVRWPSASKKALLMAQKQAIPGIFDADVAAPEVLQALLPLASHVIASEPAATILTGQSDPALAAENLSHQAQGFVAVTAGARGTFWLPKAGGTARHVPTPQVRAVDTLGAGDVFHGSFAVALAEGMPLETCLQFASSAAALKCTRPGGRLGAPERADTMALMQKTYGASAVSV